MPEANYIEKIYCPRCEHLVASESGFEYLTIATALAGLIFLLVATSGPVLSLSTIGLESDLLLLEIPYTLWQHDMQLLSLLVGAQILLFPMTLTCAHLILSAAMVADTHRHWLKWLTIALSTLNQWSMVEVFLIGLIVSLVKLYAMASISINIALIGYLGFVICLAASTSMFSQVLVWEWLDSRESSS